MSFLDLFSGTGSISYEFVSRGCKKIVAVEQDEQGVKFIRKMKEEWKIDGMEIIKSDVFRFLDSTHQKFDVIFAGPPYALKNIDELPEKIFSGNLLHDEGWFILETDTRHDFTSYPAFSRKTNYGQTTFHFFRKKSNPIA